MAEILFVTIKNSNGIEVNILLFSPLGTMNKKEITDDGISSHKYFGSLSLCVFLFISI